MPYFKNNNVNILFIHIPKTGGTSLEKYFSSKYNILLNNKSLFSSKSVNKIYNIILNTTLQHMTYQTIIKYNKYFNINFDNIKIITIVRNPYERIISDLFYLSHITINNTKEEVFDIIQKYLLSNNLDNHNIPQHVFITDNNRKLIPYIHILHTETLTDEVHELGYKDFNIYTNVNLIKEQINYYDYLNSDSIQSINNYYDYDFKLFNYDKL